MGVEFVLRPSSLPPAVSTARVRPHAVERARTLVASGQWAEDVPKVVDQLVDRMLVARRL